MAVFYIVFYKMRTARRKGYFRIVCYYLGMTSTAHTPETRCELWLKHCRAMPARLTHRETGSALIAAAAIKASYIRMNMSLPPAVSDTLCDMLGRTTWSCDNNYLLDLSSSTQDLILNDEALYAFALSDHLIHRFALVNALLFDMGAKRGAGKIYENTRVWCADLPKKPKPGMSAVAELLALWSDDPERRTKWTFLMVTEKMFSDNIPGHTRWQDSNLDTILDLAFRNIVPGSFQHVEDLPAGVSFEIN